MNLFVIRKSSKRYSANSSSGDNGIVFQFVGLLFDSVSIILKQTQYSLFAVVKLQIVVLTMSLRCTNVRANCDQPT